MPMTRLFVAALYISTLALNSCDNRTRDDDRWEKIAEAQRKDKNVQPWSEAKSPWSTAEYREGTAW
jgi:hypothetical protein